MACGIMSWILASATLLAAMSVSDPLPYTLIALMAATAAIAAARRGRRAHLVEPAGFAAIVLGVILLPAPMVVGSIVIWLI